MTPDNVIQLIQNHESDSVEYTTATKDIDKFSKTICAFSNDFPSHKKSGYLLIGIQNRDGNRCGLTVTDELLKDLSSIHDNGGIQPLPSLIIQKVSFPDGDVAIVEVKPSPMPPVRYKGQVWIRVGPTCRVASEFEEKRLAERRVSSQLTFDARPCLGSQLQELNEELFRITYLPNAVAKEVIQQNRSFVEQLASLRFYDLHANCPTHAGILLFGEDPRRWLPGAYIQWLLIHGKELTDPVIEEREFSGDLITLLQILNQFIPTQIRQRSRFINSFQEKMLCDYPIVAIREIVMNAIMHRNYDGSTSPIRIHWFQDRIEIQNPGGLYGEATRENFPRQTAYRNPVLAEIMKQLGYVNRFGVGVIRAQKELQDNGNPPPEFIFESNFVNVTLRNKP